MNDKKNLIKIDNKYLKAEIRTKKPSDAFKLAEVIAKVCEQLRLEDEKE